jgi:hypothetical protein
MTVGESLVRAWANALEPTLNVCFWHLADIRGAATFCPLLGNSGQSSILAGDGLSAYDPKRTKVTSSSGSFVC